MSFSRIKVWTKEKLKFRDLNGEFNNILNNFNSGALDSSAAVTDAENPVDNTGVPVAASSELKDVLRLRYQLAKLFGLTYYYQDPGRNLQAVPEDLQTFVNFTAASKHEAFVRVIRKCAIINAIRWSVADFNPDSDAGTLSSATVGYGSYSFACGANRALALPGKLVSSGSVLVRAKALADGDYYAYNPLLGIEVYRSGTHVVAKLTRPDALSDYVKGTTTITGSTDISSGASFRSTLLQFLATDTGTDYLKLFDEGLADASTAGALNIAPPVSGDNPHDFSGGVWFFGAKPAAITWQKYLAMNATPDALAVAGDQWKPYTAVGVLCTGATTPTIAQATGQGTIKNIDVATVATPAYLRIAGAGFSTLYGAPAGYVDLSNQTIECKVRLLSADTTNGGFDICSIDDVDVNGTGKAAALRVRLTWDGYLSVASKNDVGLVFARRKIALNHRQFNVIRITSVGSPHPVVKIYINGVMVYSFTNADESTGFAAGGDRLMFGVDFSHGNASADVEYYAVKGNGAAVAPLTNNSTGFIDEVALINGSPVTSVVASLAANSAAKVYGRDLSPGPYITPETIFPAVSGDPSTFAPEEIQVIADGANPVQYGFSGKFTANQADAAAYASGDGLALLTQSYPVGNATVVVSKTGSQQPSAGLHTMGVAISGATPGTCSLTNVNFTVLKTRAD